MPLNPNGKVDKPALPFPDTTQLSAASNQNRQKGSSTLDPKNAYDASWSQTARNLRDIWKSLLPMVTEEIQLADDFFDIGGHSILATRMIFEVRNKFVADVPLGLVFKQPTLGGLAEEIERFGRGTEIRLESLKSTYLSGPATPTTEKAMQAKTDYSSDARKLAADLPKKIQPAGELVPNKDHAVFLTGTTGFLGAFLIRELLSSKAPNVKIYAHVRADTLEKGMSRIKKSCQAYSVWEQDWEHRIVPITGDLAKPKLGIDEKTWTELTEKIDFIIHNGAQVC